jgi:hypothetical protein
MSECKSVANGILFAANLICRLYLLKLAIYQALPVFSRRNRLLSRTFVRKMQKYMHQCRRKATFRSSWGGARISLRKRAFRRLICIVQISKYLPIHPPLEITGILQPNQFLSFVLRQRHQIAPPKMTSRSMRLLAPAPILLSEDHPVYCHPLANSQMLKTNDPVWLHLKEHIFH